MEETNVPKPNAQRVYVVLRATWGNDDAESTIRISRRQWKNIQLGARFVRATWAYYEGRRFRATWTFENETFTIDCDDGMQCVVDRDVSELTPELSPTQETPDEQDLR